MTDEQQEQRTLPPENGMKFHLTFLQDLGVSPYSILEGAWVLPAIIRGVRQEVWAETLKPNQDADPILSLWIELGLLEPIQGSDGGASFELSFAGKNIVSVADLFEYEFSMMQQQLDSNFTTDPERYRKLRNALAIYSENYLDHITQWMRSHAGETILDFGGGSGYYLREILKGNPKAVGDLYDKAPELKQDGGEELKRLTVVANNFRSNSTFFLDAAASYDTVLMSEVLHCLAPQEYAKVLLLLRGLLSEGGKLIIIEQRPNFRLDWRLHDMTAGGTSLSIDMVVDRLTNIPEFDLMPKEIITTATHFGIIFRTGE